MTYKETLIPLETAQSYVLERITKANPIAINIRDALGLTLAQDVTSPENIPPFRNTASDGYALRSTDTLGASKDSPISLEVVATIAAGDNIDPHLGPMQSARIMTGAPIPADADSVIMVEDTSPDPEVEGNVLVYKEVRPGDSVREAGSDVEEGQVVLLAGTKITPASIGVLASLGYKKVPVFPRAKVAVISTGSELTESAEPLRRAMIRDSNRPALLSAITGSGFEAYDLGIVPDDKEALETAFKEAASNYDAIVTSGGVSVGDFDLTKQVLKDLSGGEMRWMQVAIKPAKPFAFGLIEGTPLFGLPGNPVSALVSFELFARPAILKMMGSPQPFRPLLKATLADEIRRNRDGKVHFLRASYHSVDGELRVSIKAGQMSHMLSQMASSNCLLVVPEGEIFEAGERLPIIPLEQAG
jgi:molybdopterin molybdotransferase